MRNFTVDTEDDGIRLDRWFKRHFESLSMNELNRCLREKNIKLNGAKATNSTRISAGDIILCPDAFKIYPTDKHKLSRDITLSDKEQKEIQSWIVYKDNDIIAINKPSGLAVQGGSKQKHHLDNMLSALSLGIKRPKLVHRLDKDTSGALLLARNDLAATWLTRAFKERGIKKVYYAILEGAIKKTNGIIKTRLHKALIGNQEMVVADKNIGLEAITEYKIISSSSEASFVEFHPLTGRTHQLRVHSGYIGHPIIGDRKYGNGTGNHKLLLHSARIDIPCTDGFISVIAPIPDYMRQAAESLKLNIGDIV